MRYHDIEPSNGSTTWPAPDVKTLAEKALVKIAGQSTRKNGVLCSSLLDQFSASLLDPMDGAHCDTVAQMTANGISATDIIDLYIPESARQIGDLWVSDQCSFVDVSVAASRLQRLLRSVARRFDATVFLDQPPQRVLIVVPEGEQHSLGGALVVNQMQRAGIGAEITLGTSLETLRALVAKTPYALVGLSVGSEKTLDRIGTLIDAIIAEKRHPASCLVAGQSTLCLTLWPNCR
jgi:methanogenic corrinoid protein MtbC1